MTSNLKFAMEANKTYQGVNNTTGKEIEFNSGDKCEAAGACIMNGNTRQGVGAYENQWYYSWYAAAAGSEAEANMDAPYSICPARWRNPPDYKISSAIKYSYGYLTNAYGYTSNYQNNYQNHTGQFELFPFDLVRAGASDDGGSFGGEGIFGIYWSSTADSPNTSADTFLYTVQHTYPRDVFQKFRGFSMRCVAL